MVPADDEAWTDAIDRELYESGPAAELEVAFVQRLLPRRHGVPDERVAAEWVLDRYAPSIWKLDHFERRGSTLLVALNVDSDAYAGVSQTRRFVQPVLERTLLCQPGVTRVLRPAVTGPLQFGKRCCSRAAPGTRRPGHRAHPTLSGG